MFARLKDNGSGAVYLQLVQAYRVRNGQGGWARSGPPKQRVLATLGRVDHLPKEERDRVRQRLTAALEGIIPPKYRASARQQRALTDAAAGEGS